MVDSNYNMIKPVEGLQNIAGLTPVKQREKRNRQKNQEQQDQQHSRDTEQMAEEILETETDDSNQQPPDDSNSIDYCA